jgi:hypothetical protein
MTNETVKMSNGAETAEEIIGVLTAISVISKRMATKLAMLEKLNESEEKNVRKNKPPD